MQDYASYYWDTCTLALYQQLRSAFFSRVSMAVQFSGEAVASLGRVQVSQ